MWYATHATPPFPSLHSKLPSSCWGLVWKAQAQRGVPLVVTHRPLHFWMRAQACPPTSQTPTWAPFLLLMHW
ncbi:hypothetical protein BDV98DRAFT_568283 [Pterulicium gracile]|uniref:Uncharacterized protein n=1 Tax=Pterulicium gracile TaxID=1884261 RepID=A0A5C3QFZ4_9AGAR|nr:hypothetical protein BDV98DRAFT_568283 [Pterula gracilis]